MVDPFERYPKGGSTYFAHPINLFSTPLKAFLLDRIRERFPDDQIEDPDTPAHASGYARDGMAYFLNEVIPGFTRVVFLAFRDDYIGTGVFAEASAFLNGREVYEIFPDGTIVRRDALDEGRKLGVLETRERIRNPDGSLKPY